jgi:thiol:disulfide interchange protein
MAQTNDQSKTSKFLFAAALLLIGARVVWHFLPSRTHESESLVHWVTIEDAPRLAATSNRPMLIDFTAAWCGPCQSLDAEVFRDPATAKEINARFVPVRVTDRQREDGHNSQAVSDLQRRFGVNGFPTVVLADANWTERARMEGYGGRERFRQVMETVR